MRRVFLAVLCIVVAALAAAQVQTETGPYRLSLTTRPAVIPVGRATLEFRLSDHGGKPVEGAELRAIARMPGMFMGEREQTARPGGEPGLYAMEAAFPMAGEYEVAVRISAPPGPAEATLKVRTGQNLGGGHDHGGGFPVGWLLAALGAAAVGYTLYRLRKTGQKPAVGSMLTRGTVGGVVLLAAMLVGSVLAVRHLRRPGAMTPLEAQIMEMNTPAPPGFSAVEVAVVREGSLQPRAAYFGQAVGYVEQDVNPRVGGTIVEMPVYVGDRVRRGQVLARLDTSAQDPMVAEKRSAAEMAREAKGVAAAEQGLALSGVEAARHELESKKASLEEAEAMLSAEQDQVQAAQAVAEAARAEAQAAAAEVPAAEERNRFESAELGRMRAIHEKGAVSLSELQAAEARAAEAAARLRQARSLALTATARAEAAVADSRRAEARLKAARLRVQQARSEWSAAKARLEQSERARDAAAAKVAREAAAIRMAEAGLRGAATLREYATLTAPSDGVVTARLVSPGTTVAPGQTVLRIAQDQPIRLQANVAATDLSRVRVGSSVEVLFPDLDSEPVAARVTSVGASVDPRSRTALVEALWANRDRRVAPGQSLTMRVPVGSPASGLLVPAEAVDRGFGTASGDRAHVWLAEPGGAAGRYTVKRVSVELVASDGDTAVVRGPLQPGQLVVRKGAANLRDGQEVAASNPAPVADRVTVEVQSSGYVPATIRARKGVPLTITFIRKTDETCGTEVVFPDLKLEKPLPLNQPVTITITPQKSGELRFTCGMDMYDGKVVVE